MKKIKLDFVLFDMIGTTIQDTNAGNSLILDSFHQAFANNGYQISYDKLNQERGKRKQEAIQNILLDANLNLELTDKIYAEFMDLLNDSVTAFQEVAGASEVFRFLKSKNIKIGIGSGLPLQFMHNLIHHIGWQLTDFDYIGSSDELAEGRPHPIMILDAIQQLGLGTAATILKIGDTVVDIKEGKNAGVLTALVLTGTQGKSNLGQLVPDYVFESVNDLIFS